MVGDKGSASGFHRHTDNMDDATSLAGLDVVVADPESNNVVMTEGDDDQDPVDDDEEASVGSASYSSDHHHQHHRMSTGASNELKGYQRGYRITHCLALVLLVSAAALVGVAVLFLPSSASADDDLIRLLTIERVSRLTYCLTCCITSSYSPRTPLFPAFMGLVDQHSHRIIPQFALHADHLLNQIETEFQVVSVGLESMSQSSTVLAIESNVSWPFASELLFPSPASSRTNESLLIINPFFDTSVYSLSVGIFVGQDEQEEWISYSHSAIPDKYAELPPFPVHIWEKASQEASAGDAIEDHISEWRLIPPMYHPSNEGEDDSEESAFVEALLRMQSHGQTVLSRPFGVPGSTDGNTMPGTKSVFLQPIYVNSFAKETFPGSGANSIVGYWKAAFEWTTLIDSLRVDNNRGSLALAFPQPPLPDARLVVKNTCGSSMTFQLNEAPASASSSTAFQGYGEYHDHDAFKNEHDLDIVQTLDIPIPGCNYSLGIYPSRQNLFASESTTTGNASVDTAWVLGLVSLGLMILLGIALWVNDWHVRKIEVALEKSATRSMAVVHSLFPATVRDRILEEGLTSSRRQLVAPKRIHKSRAAIKGANRKDNDASLPAAPSAEVASTETSPSSSHKTAENILSSVETALSLTSPPIADFFPSATVLFADVVGFTAWASIREPSHVFALLEAIYDSFDKICKKKDVFKVEVSERKNESVWCGRVAETILTSFATCCVSHEQHCRLLEIVT